MSRRYTCETVADRIALARMRERALNEQQAAFNQRRLQVEAACAALVAVLLAPR